MSIVKGSVNRALFTVMALSLGSCFFSSSHVKMNVNHYFGDSRDVNTVRRILVLPLRIGDSVKVDELMIRKAFIRELNLLQRFQVEALPNGDDQEIAINAAFGHGDVSISALIALSKRYNLDGVMIGRITSYRAYQPPHIGLEARLFSLHTGSWVWIADATFDTDSAVCTSDLNHYVQTALPETDLRDESGQIGLVMISPSRFAAYACHRVVGTWRQE